MVALLLCLLAVPVFAAGARVPAGFFGVVPQAPLQDEDFARLGRLGLTVRLSVRWYAVEPREGDYDFGELDAVVAAAAARHVALLPQVGGSPSWLAADPADPPLSRRALGAWRRLLGRLIGRYGPRGEFWRGRKAREPLRSWQIWNEPNFGLFWRHPAPAAYARLLRASAATIRRRDPGARIVLGGVAPAENFLWPWEFLRRLYRTPGIESDFDVVALHPYAPSLRGVEYEIRHTRRVMAAAGDGRTPLLLSEIGVASAGSVPSPMVRGRRGQARFLERTFGRLAAMRGRWRLAGAYWFTWEDALHPDPNCVFCQHAGLFTAGGESKPAWSALRRVVARHASASLAA